MLRAFPMSLTGAASRWLRNKPSGSITTWEDLKIKFPSKYCLPARTAKKMEEINNFQQETNKTLYQAWKRFKELLMRNTSIKVNGKNAYELKGKFLNDLHNNAFNGTNGEDAVEHIEYFLRIIDPIDLPNVNQDKLRVLVFPISLVGDAWKCSNEDGFCNGGELPGMVLVGYMRYFQDHEWYNDLMNGSLKDEALEQKAICEESWGDAKQSVINFYGWLKKTFGNFHELDYGLLEKLQDYWLKDLAAKKSTKLVKYLQSGILAHKLNLENLPSKISGEFLILILLIPVFNVLSNNEDVI
ncbi:hypothetical protein Tco_1057931 [Tanacetum coccineum]|uniref:Retrotransposon gag domain-containing protein n=1 Tax=Tanacetum coccineum TaxID=301880 RepID=A0ABQ5H6Z7_9ASTR